MRVKARNLTSLAILDVRMFKNIYSTIVTSTPLAPGGVYLRESINQRTAVSISLSWCISYSGGNHLKVTVIGDGLIQSDIIYHHQSWLKGVATLTSLSPDTMYSVGIRVDYPGGNVKSKIRTLKTLYGNGKQAKEVLYLLIFLISPFHYEYYDDYDDYDCYYCYVCIGEVTEKLRFCALTINPYIF